MATPFNNVFPFVPQHSTWENFNGNLIMYYGQEPIPYSVEANWMVTAKNMAQLPSFSVYPLPDPEKYSNWQDWASEFALIVNGNPR